MSEALKRVWLVDDDPDEQFLLAHAFKRSGLCNDTVAFLDPVDCAKQLELDLTSGAELPQIVVVDMNMPGMDGIHLIHLIEEMLVASGVPLMDTVLLTSALPPGIHERTQGLSSLRGSLEKPLTSLNLRSTLQRLGLFQSQEQT